MIIRKGNLSLIRLTENDIELVRRWRNCEEIQQFMEYREHISHEMQLKWFRTVDNINNLYSIVSYEGKKIGLCNGKNIDWEKGSMEGGIFIWDKNYQNTPVPVIIFIILAELSLFKMNLNIHAHILQNNERAKRFNKLLGFQITEGQENIENQHYILTKDSYLKHAKKIRILAQNFEKESNREVLMPHESLKTDFGKHMKLKLDSWKMDRKIETDEGIIYRF